MSRIFSVGIYHTILKKKRNRHLYQDFPFCQTKSTITLVPIGSQLSNARFRSVASSSSKFSRSTVRCGAEDIVLYVRLGALAKLKYLHSKIGRRVDFARVRYGTMRSESMRLGIQCSLGFIKLYEY
jgi:hypothetical protein